MQLYLWIFVIVFFTGFIKGLSGFATMLVALPLLVIIIDIKTVVPFVTLLGASATIFLLIQLVRHLEWKEIYRLLVGAIPGIVIGVFFLKTLDEDILQFILGIVLIFYSIYTLFFNISTLRIGKGWAYIFGFFSGLLRGTIGPGGPPVIIYTSLQPWSKYKIKVTLQGYFVISGLITILIQACTGLITMSVLTFFIISLPLFALGTYLGSYFYGTIREESYKKIISVLLAVLGFLVIYKAIY